MLDSDYGRRERRTTGDSRSTPLVSPSFLSGGDFRWRERGKGSTKKGRRVPFPPNVFGSCVYSEFHALKIYLFVLSSLISLILLLEGRKAGGYWELGFSIGARLSID